ncbi:MAG: lipid II:glycine glycyltransferase FemX [Actinomycetales bacterium]
MRVEVRPISTEDHLQWIAEQPWVSFLQLPQWSALKPGWRHESLGWFVNGSLIGAGLVRYRPVPRYPRRSLAYLPEGPCLPWEDTDASVAELLDPLIAHCAGQGAFLVKIGPGVANRRWQADTIKDGLKHASITTGGALHRLTDLPCDWQSPTAATFVEGLQAAGWRSDSSSGRFGDYQPRLVFQIPLQDRSAEDLLAGFNQQWRRNIRKAEQLGVRVSWGGTAQLDEFHRIYCETATRDGFTPRGIGYFQALWQSLGAPSVDTQSRTAAARLACAEVPNAAGEFHLGAAALAIQVGQRVWYSYGASTTADRDARPSNAVQWAQMQQALALGADIYDMRGIVDTVDPRHDQVGLIQFKVGTGGYAQEVVGEWDYIIRPTWARAFRAYESRR